MRIFGIRQRYPYVRVKGKWCYLYRGIDEDGNLVDVRLSEKRDMEAAKAFFAQAHEIAAIVPQRVITDGHTSYPRAIAEELGAEVEHEVRSCLGYAHWLWDSYK